MTVSDVGNALAPAFAAGVGVQHLNEVLDPVATLLSARLKGDVNTKKTILGWTSIVAGLVIAFSFDLHIVALLGVSYSGWASSVDVIVTALIISTGTEGINSIVKFLSYAKEQKKAQTAEVKDAANGKIQTINRGPNQ